MKGTLENISFVLKNTVHRRIVDMSEYFRFQVESMIKQTPLGAFSIQLAESRLLTCLHVLSYYVLSDMSMMGIVKTNFSFTSFKTAIRGVDILKNLKLQTVTPPI